MFTFSVPWFYAFDILLALTSTLLPSTVDNGAYKHRLLTVLKIIEFEYSTDSDLMSSYLSREAMSPLKNFTTIPTQAWSLMLYAWFTTVNSQVWWHKCTGWSWIISMGLRGPVWQLASRCDKYNTLHVVLSLADAGVSLAQYSQRGEHDPRVCRDSGW